MADLIAVVALNNWAIDLIRIFRTLGLHMTKLLAVGALWDATVNRFTSILQTLSIFLGGAGPAALLLWTRRLVGPAPGNSILLVKISLEVHWKVSS
jgi:hypothetical protein